MSVAASSPHTNEYETKSPEAWAQTKLGLPKDPFILSELQDFNYFSSKEHYDTILRIASLARLIPLDVHAHPDLFKKVDALFPQGLQLLPTPGMLQIAFPENIKVLSFKHGNQVILGISAATSDKDLLTCLSSLLIDNAVGRHQSDEDLLWGVDTAKVNAHNNYNYTFSDQAIAPIKLTLSSRITGDKSRSRFFSMANNIGKGLFNGWSQGWDIGANNPATSATSFVASTKVSPWVGKSIPVLFGTVGAIAGTVAGTVKGTYLGMTEKDGYPTLLANVKALHDYIAKLQNEGHISKSHEIITVGHSLGGYLAAIIGTHHAAQIYAFNSPGLLREEAQKIFSGLAIKPSTNKAFYTSISMDGDLIGNLGKRDGYLKRLSLSTGSPQHDEDKSVKNEQVVYDSPLALHSMDILHFTLRKACSVGSDHFSKHWDSDQ